MKHSHLFLFAYDTKCLEKVSSLSDCHSLQEDLQRLSSWSLQWNLHFNASKCVLLRFCSKLPPIHFNYIINGSPIQAINCHRDLGILMSSDLKWSNHLMFISSGAFKILGLIRRTFPSGLHISAKKNLYITLICSQLTYASQIWRPHLIKDILALERIQRRATKYILNDFHSDYKHRLLSLNLLPLMMQLELYDVLFFIRCLKNPNTSNAFSILSYVHFSTRITRSSTHQKLTHSVSKSNASAHHYFNRLPQLELSSANQSRLFKLIPLKVTFIKFYGPSLTPVFSVLTPVLSVIRESVDSLYRDDTV